MRSKIPQLAEALTGNFGDHHAFLRRLHLGRIDQLSASILELSRRIEDEMRPFTRQLEHLVTIPGVGQATAEVIIAETGADMTQFRTASPLADLLDLCGQLSYISSNWRRRVSVSVARCLASAARVPAAATRA